MRSSEPKYRRPLNEDQLDLLRVLYIYRFVTSQQLAEYFHKPNAKFIQKRLLILGAQCYIAKHYD